MRTISVADPNPPSVVTDKLKFKNTKYSVILKGTHNSRFIYNPKLIYLKQL